MPILTITSPINSHHVHTKFFGEIFIHFFSVSIFSNIAHLFLGQFMEGVRLSMSHLDALLTRGIAHILRVSSQEKMLWVYASGIVAMMTNFYFGIHKIETKMKIGNDAVRSIQLATNTHVTIWQSSFLRSTSPFNTVAIGAGFTSGLDYLLNALRVGYKNFVMRYLHYITSYHTYSGFVAIVNVHN